MNERQQWEAEGEKAGTRRVPSLNPCSPALVSARRCTPHYPLGASGNKWGEEVGCVEREEFALTLEKMEGGVLAADVGEMQKRGVHAFDSFS